MPLLADAGSFYELVDKGGVIALLCAVVFTIIVGGMRGWYALKPYIDLLLQQIEDRDEIIKEERRRNDAIQAELTATREELWRTLGTMERAVTPPRRPRLGGGS